MWKKTTRRLSKIGEHRLPWQSTKEVPKFPEDRVKNVLDSNVYVGLCQSLLLEGAFIQLDTNGRPLRQVYIGVTETDFILLLQNITKETPSDLVENDLIIDLVCPLKFLQFFLLDDRSCRFAVSTCVGEIMYFEMCQMDGTCQSKWMSWRYMILHILDGYSCGPGVKDWQSPYILHLTNPGQEMVRSNKNEDDNNFQFFHFLQHQITLKQIEHSENQVDDASLGIKAAEIKMECKIVAELSGSKARIVATPSFTTTKEAYATFYFVGETTAKSSASATAINVQDPVLENSQKRSFSLKAPKGVRASCSCPDLGLHILGHREKKRDTMNDTAMAWIRLDLQTRNDPNAPESCQKLRKLKRKLRLDRVRIRKILHSDDSAEGTPTEDTDGEVVKVKTASTTSTSSYAPRDDQRRGSNPWEIARMKLMRPLKLTFQDITHDLFLKVKNKSLVTDSLTRFSPDNLAVELLLVNRMLLLAITTADMSKMLGNTTSLRRLLFETPGLQNMKRFNENFSLIVAKEVLGHDSVLERSKVLIFFLKVCRRLRLLHDFQSMHTVYQGLTIPPVQRLYHTWSSVQRSRPDLYSLYLSMQVLYASTNGYSLYTSRLRKLLRAGTPVLPWFEHFVNHLHLCKPRIGNLTNAPVRSSTWSRDARRKSILSHHAQLEAKTTADKSPRRKSTVTSQHQRKRGNNNALDQQLTEQTLSDPKNEENALSSDESIPEKVLSETECQSVCAKPSRNQSVPTRTSVNPKLAENFPFCEESVQEKVSNGSRSQAHTSKPTLEQQVIAEDRCSRLKKSGRKNVSPRIKNQTAKGQPTLNISTTSQTLPSTKSSAKFISPKERVPKSVVSGTRSQSLGAEAGLKQKAGSSKSKDAIQKSVKKSHSASPKGRPSSSKSSVSSQVPTKLKKASGRTNSSAARVKNNSRQKRGNNNALKNTTNGSSSTREHSSKTPALSQGPRVPDVSPDNRKSSGRKVRSQLHNNKERSNIGVEGVTHTASSRKESYLSKLAGKVAKRGEQEASPPSPKKGRNNNSGRSSSSLLSRIFSSHGKIDRSRGSKARQSTTSQTSNEEPNESDDEIQSLIQKTDSDEAVSTGSGESLKVESSAESDQQEETNEETPVNILQDSQVSVFDEASDENKSGTLNDADSDIKTQISDLIQRIDQSQSKTEDESNEESSNGGRETASYEETDSDNNVKTKLSKLIRRIDQSHSESESELAARKSSLHFTANPSFVTLDDDSRTEIEISDDTSEYYDESQMSIPQTMPKAVHSAEEGSSSETEGPDSEVDEIDAEAFRLLKEEEKKKEKWRIERARIYKHLSHTLRRNESAVSSGFSDKISQISSRATSTVNRTFRRIVRAISPTPSDTVKNTSSPSEGHTPGHALRTASRTLSRIVSIVSPTSSDTISNKPDDSLSNIQSRSVDITPSRVSSTASRSPSSSGSTWSNGGHSASVNVMPSHVSHTASRSPSSSGSTGSNGGHSGSVDITPSRVSRTASLSHSSSGSTESNEGHPGSVDITPSHVSRTASRSASSSGSSGGHSGSVNITPSRVSRTASRSHSSGSTESNEVHPGSLDLTPSHVSRTASRSASSSGSSGGHSGSVNSSSGSTGSKRNQSGLEHSDEDSSAQAIPYHVKLQLQAGGLLTKEPSKQTHSSRRMTLREGRRMSMFEQAAAKHEDSNSDEEFKDQVQTRLSQIKKRGSIALALLDEEEPMSSNQNCGKKKNHMVWLNRTGPQLVKERLNNNSKNENNTCKDTLKRMQCGRTRPHPPHKFIVPKHEHGDSVCVLDKMYITIVDPNCSNSALSKTKMKAAELAATLSGVISKPLTPELACRLCGYERCVYGSILLPSLYNIQLGTAIYKLNSNNRIRAALTREVENIDEVQLHALSKRVE